MERSISAAFSVCQTSRTHARTHAHTHTVTKCINAYAVAQQRVPTLCTQLLQKAMQCCLYSQRVRLTIFDREQGCTDCEILGRNHCLKLTICPMADLDTIVLISLFNLMFIFAIYSPFCALFYNKKYVFQPFILQINYTFVKNNGFRIDATQQIDQCLWWTHHIHRLTSRTNQAFIDVSPQIPCSAPEHESHTLSRPLLPLHGSVTPPWVTAGECTHIRLGR